MSPRTMAACVRSGVALRTRQVTSAAVYRKTFTTTSYARSTATTASQAVEQLKSASETNSAIRRQVLDANQLQKLSLTLGRSELDGVDIAESPPKTGTPVPPGWHLVYFTPGGLETQLGADGTDRTFNSIAPFTRRMWAGGRMQWSGPELRVGDEVEERTRFVNATAKKNKKGQEMILVEIEKEFWGPRGLSLVDQRSWVFQPEVQQKTSEERIEGVSGSQEPSTVRDEVVGDHPQRHLQWSPVGLFRFSALTFNAHKIHYNHDWTRGVEGHRGEVVHGPLNLINMLDYGRDHHGSKPTEISYRAMSPIYAGESYLVKTANIEDVESGKAYEIVVDKKGTICMKGTIRCENPGS